jgi:hypothetical protein
MTIYAFDDNGAIVAITGGSGPTLQEWIAEQAEDMARWSIEDFIAFELTACACMGPPVRGTTACSCQLIHGMAEKVIHQRIIRQIINRNA